MAIIEIITSREKNEHTGKRETIVSHGVNMDTGKSVILPQETPNKLGAKWHRDLGWYLKE